MTFDNFNYEILILKIHNFNYEIVIMKQFKKCLQLRVPLDNSSKVAKLEAVL